MTPGFGVEVGCRREYCQNVDKEVSIWADNLNKVALHMPRLNPGIIEKLLHDQS